MCFENSNVRLAVAHAAKVFGGVGQERQVARPLDRISERTLVFGTGAGLAPRFDAGTIGYEPAEEVDVLVVHYLDLVSTHNAYPAPAAGPASGPFLIAAGGPGPFRSGEVGAPRGTRGVFKGCGLGDRLGSFVFVRGISLSHFASLFEGNILGSHVSAANREGIALFGQGHAAGPVEE